jgi:hypothetical protein
MSTSGGKAIYAIRTSGLRVNLARGFCRLWGWRFTLNQDDALNLIAIKILDSPANAYENFNEAWFSPHAVEWRPRAADSHEVQKAAFGFHQLSGR